MSLASRGLRDLDQGPQTIADAAELDRVRRQAARVHRWAVATAMLLTLAGLALP